MKPSNSIYTLIQYNDYNKLENIINSYDVELLKNNTDLIETAIKYRSTECFDLLIESNIFDPSDIKNNGLLIALEYYCNAKNETNMYYIYKLKNKSAIFSYQAINIIISCGCIDDFSDVIILFININPTEHIKIILIMSLCDIITFKKIINIGLSMNLINNDLAIDIIKTSPKEKQMWVIIEFVNNNLNIFENQDIIMSFFLDNFYDYDTIQFMIDYVLLFNPNINLSLLIVNYINNNVPNNCTETTHFICKKFYYILINYHILKKLNCNFFEGIDILTLIINKVISSLLNNYCTANLDENLILILIKLVDLFLEEKIIDNTTVVKKTTASIDHFKKKHKKQIFNYNNLQYILYLLQYLENKGIKSNDFNEIKNIVIPNINIIDIQNLIPKKINSIKI